MREETVRTALGALERVAASTDARTRAQANMLAAFDSLETGPAEADPLESDEVIVSGAHGELLQLLRDSRQDEHVEKDPPRRLPLVAAAVVVVIALLVGGAAVGGLFDRDDALEVADSPGVTGDEAVEDLTSDEFVDAGLPRLIEGRFTTGVLGGTTSFVVREPLWLVRHESQLVRLVADPDDPESASMTIARPGIPAVAITGNQRVVDFLGSNADGVNFQLQPLEVGGVATTYGRGRISGSGCIPAEPCLVLYNSPIPIGLYENVTNDFVERPMSDGGTVVLMAAIPFAEFDLAPFGEPFASIIDTITFTDTEPNEGSG